MEVRLGVRRQGRDPDAVVTSLLPTAVCTPVPSSPTIPKTHCPLRTLMRVQNQFLCLGINLCAVALVGTLWRGCKPDAAERHSSRPTIRALGGNFQGRSSVQTCCAPLKHACLSTYFPYTHKQTLFLCTGPSNERSCSSGARQRARHPTLALVSS